ncbi:MAG: sulfatase-like hydrolase/transferase [Candidatus Hydrogenedentota bacterium]
MKRYLGMAVRLALVVAIFVFIFRPEWLGFDKGLFGEVNPTDVFNVIKDAFVNHPGRVGFWLGFACIVKLLGITAGVIRWKLLLRGQQLKMPLVYMIYLWFMGRAIGLFLPGTLGLDGFRLVESSRYTGEWLKCTTVIVVEKIIGFIALSFILLVTLPLGWHLLGVQLSALPFALVIPLGVLVVGLLLLLNPRVIQVGMASIPTPGFIRTKVNKLGVAATTYSGRKFTLMLAVLFGILVHTGTIFMYFGCRMAMGVSEITLQEVLFASSLIIGLSVLTPTVSGLGVREFVGAAVIGAKVAPALGIGMTHLGLWAGEFVPYVLSVPLLLFGGRPSKEQLEADVAELRARAAEGPVVDLNLGQDEIRFYRRKVFGTLFCGVFAGAFVGILVALAESGWLLYNAGVLETFTSNGVWTLDGLRTAIGAGGFAETGMFWWGAIAYGALFAGLGLAIAAGFLFLFLIADRFPAWQVAFGMVFGVAAGIGALVFGLWRYQRDVLGESPIDREFLLAVGQGTMGLILEAFLVAALLAVIVGWIARNKPVVVTLLALLLLGGSITGTYFLAQATQPPRETAAFEPPAQAQGPNIIFIGLDALRADYLRIYKDAEGHDRMDALVEAVADAPAPASGGGDDGVAEDIGETVVRAEVEDAAVPAGNTQALAPAGDGMTPEQREQLEALGYLDTDATGTAPAETDPPAEAPVVDVDAPDFALPMELPADWEPTPQPMNPYRPPSATLPAIEAFAEDALLFEWGFAQASWTKPSFATIFTGLYPEEHTAYTKAASLPDEVDTVAEVLRDAGYYTVGFPNNPNTRAYFNFDQGHIEYIDLAPRRVLYATPSAARLTIYEIARRVVGLVEGKILGKALNVRDFYRPAEDVTDYLIDWIDGERRPDHAPFYAYIHYMDPHDPFMDPSAAGGGYARRDLAHPDLALDKAMDNAYVSDIKHMDEHMGRLFDELKERGLYEDTLIMVISDHGEEFADHGGWWHGQTLYEEMIHVPYIIKLPGNKHGGRRVDGMARHIDLMPTMLQYAGAPIPEAVRGIPLFDPDDNPANSGISESYAHNELESNRAVAVRTRGGKLIYMDEGEKYFRNMPPIELYDLEQNPLENWDQNLVRDPAHVDMHRRLHGLLEEHLEATAGETAGDAGESTDGGEEPAASEADDDPVPDAQMEQLEALGYLE